MYYGALLKNVADGDLYRGKGAMRFAYQNGGLLKGAGLVVKDGKLAMSGVGSEEDNLFMKGIAGMNPVKKLDKKLFKLGRYEDLTYGDIRDTDENPLIAVLCKKINFYQGTKAFVKYVQLEDYILAVLVYGICEFVDDEGNGTVMYRCYTADYEGKQKHTYTAQDMKRLTHMIDPESGYDMSKDVVNAVVVDYSGAKAGVLSSVSYKTVGECVEVFDETGLNAAREKAAAKKAAAEAEKQRKHEQMLAFEVARKAKEAEEAKRAEEAQKATKLKAKKPRVVVSDDNDAVNDGLEAFRAAFSA